MNSFIRILMRQTAIVTLSASLTLGIGYANAQVIMNDRFNDGTRTNTNSAGETDGAWFASQNSTLSVANDAVLGSGNALFHDSPTNPGIIVANFDGPATLGNNAGDSLTLSFVYRTTAVKNAINESFRFGLFNNGGTAITADGQSTTNDFGYFANATYGGGAIIIQREVVDGFSSITGGGGSTALTLTGSTTAPAVGDTAPHLLTFAMTRNGVGGIDFRVSVDGATATATDNVPLTATFQEAGFNNQNGTDSFYDDVSVVAVVVPEPTTIGLLALGLICPLGTGIYRGRRKG